MATEKAKTKTAEPKTVAPPAPAPEPPVQYRENPRTNEKIDEWIKRNPDQFKFFNEMPHNRAVRKLILNEINKYERQQKAKAYRQQEAGEKTDTPREQQSQSAGNGVRAR